MSAYFCATVAEFVSAADDSIIGRLAAASADDGFAVVPDQVTAWEAQIQILKATLQSMMLAHPRAANWGMLLEYDIPRRRTRIDVVLLAGDLIVVVEFKVGAALFDSGAKWQAKEYAWDIRDFHKESVSKDIAPILVCTEARAPLSQALPQRSDRSGRVFSLQCTAPSDLEDAIERVYGQTAGDAAEQINVSAWDHSPFEPSFNIIEAAQELFAKHDVREIAHSHSDNITGTTDRLIQIIDATEAAAERALCFVTGVPGAGKTLVGLNAAYTQTLTHGGHLPAAFLSGNGPLVRVIKSALTRNLASQREHVRIARHEVSAFIENVHNFLANHLGDPNSRAPGQNVVVFDEAQRAWSAAHFGRQNKRKRGNKRGAIPEHYHQLSEPQLMMSVMERCPNGCIIIALIGGGQEINSGEAGLSEWGLALAKSSARWNVYTAPEALDGSHSLAGQRLFPGEVPPNTTLRIDSGLHLRVSTRSLRAQSLTEWVNLVLSGDEAGAAALALQFEEFPLNITRELESARAWLREHSAGERRCGLIASSGALRLRAHGIELSPAFRGDYPWEEWFLAGPNDVRSSYQLEVAASEFDCQGLELDWVGVCWGGDFTIDPPTRQWLYRNFVGNTWQTVRNAERRVRLLNKYRVLLTRAREGMVLWVPRGDIADATRLPAIFEATADYLTRCGAVML